MITSAKFTVEHDGEVIINGGYVEAAGEDVVALTFDLRTKYAKVIGLSNSGGDTPDGAPGILLSGDGAFHINEQRKGSPTHITFPEYADWTVHCADIARYTLKVCLVRCVQE